MKSTIRVTERAREHLKQVLAARAQDPGQCLRLVAAASGAGLVLDRIRKEDRVIEVNGRPLLLLHPVLAPVLEGTTLDYPDSGDGPQLTLTKGTGPSLDQLEG